MNVLLIVCMVIDSRRKSSMIQPLNTYTGTKAINDLLNLISLNTAYACLT